MKSQWARPRFVPVAPTSGLRCASSALLSALAQVFLAAGSETELPVDQVLVEAGDEPPLVYVPEGEIR